MQKKHQLWSVWLSRKIKDLQHVGWGVRELSGITDILFDGCHVWPWSARLALLILGISWRPCSLAVSAPGPLRASAGVWGCARFWCVFISRWLCCQGALRESRAEITSNPPFCDNVAQSEETQGSILWSGIALGGAGPWGVCSKPSRHWG